MATNVSLGEFIGSHRAALIARCLAKVSAQTDSSGTDEVYFGIPAFLDQLVEELAGPESMTRQIRADATQHGHNLFFKGFTASEVVHVYGSVCQSVTDLAVESKASFTTDDFRTLNRCLDDAIAGAVSEYTRQQRLERDGQSQGRSLQAQTCIRAALTAFEVLQTGTVGVGGTTGALLHRSLLELRELL